MAVNGYRSLASIEGIKGKYTPKKLKKAYDISIDILAYLKKGDLIANARGITITPEDLLKSASSIEALDRWKAIFEKAEKNQQKVYLGLTPQRTIGDVRAVIDTSNKDDSHAIYGYAPGMQSPQFASTRSLKWFV